MPRALEPGALPATRATLDLIATLDIRTVIPGHGDPFTDVGGARNALTQGSPCSKPTTSAPHATIKVVLAFHLLDVRTMAWRHYPGM